MFPHRNPFWGAFCRNNAEADLSLLNHRAALAAMGLELLVATIVSDSSDVFKGGAEIWSFSSDTILYQVSLSHTH